MTKQCHICKEYKTTEKTKVEVLLAEKTLVPLTFTVPVCDDCIPALTEGISKVRNTTLTLAV